MMQSEPGRLLCFHATMTTAVRSLGIVVPSLWKGLKGDKSIFRYSHGFGFSLAGFLSFTLILISRDFFRRH